jgi:proteasome lid subunit RPN8/RPN11
MNADSLAPLIEVFPPWDWPLLVGSTPESDLTLVTAVGYAFVGDVPEQILEHVVRVTDALPARHARSTPMSLTFTVADWIDLADRRACLPGRMTVGWYHTHPGMGVFFSGKDRFLHQSFFGDQPWYLALVLDPHSGEQGVFVLRDGEFQRGPGFGLEGPSLGENHEVCQAEVVFGRP